MGFLLSPRSVRIAVLVLVLALLGMAKLRFDPVPIGPNRADGTFYYLVAEFVEAGQGLKVDVSLYGKGIDPLPAATTVQPLWPLVLGLSGRFLGLERAATWLPEALFGLSLVLLYGLANRVGRALDAETWLRVRGVPILDLGAVAVVLLGTNAVFFAYTSRPVTEGLAFTLLFAALLVTPAEPGRGATARALAAGAFAGASYLTRSQFIGVAPALVTLLACAAYADRRYLRLAGWTALGSLATVAPWIVFLWTALRQRPPLRALVDFTAYRETHVLPPFSGFIESEGLWHETADVGIGLLHAFHPTATQTYVESFGPVAWTVPAAALVLLIRGVVARANPSGPPAKALPALLCAGAGAAALLPVHLAHAKFPYEWLFHWRHGLPLILLIVPASALLWTRGRTWRAALVIAFAWSLLAPAHTPERYTPGTVAGPRAPEMELALWLDARPEAPLLLTTRAREIALWSDAPAHNVRCQSPPGTARAYFAHLPIDYLILYPIDRRCPMARDVDDAFEVVRRFGPPSGPIEVLRPRLDPGIRRD